MTTLGNTYIGLAIICAALIVLLIARGGLSSLFWNRESDTADEHEDNHQ
jgi:hypothetical protein